MAGGDLVHHPYGVAFHNGIVFWSEFRLSKIMYLKLNDTSEHKQGVVWEDTSPLFEIHIVDKNGQIGKL